jgi:diaminohydroxyphosphoribosylaminopyrimidine deaminase/5-amino-6-(5-phosphoribosylamino)uracil reductase
VRARPLVVLKAGTTLDGRIADADGRSQWITGPAARQEGHRLRDALGAVLVGSGTLLADDPSLNTRVEGGRDALPVILDSSLRIPDDARVLTAGRRPLILCAPDAPDRRLAADVVRVPRAEAGLDLHAVMAVLAERGVTGVLVEGGGRVHRSFLDAGLVDRLELFVAPRILAGGPGFVGGSPWRLSDGPAFSVVSVAVVGEDVRISMERRDV